MSVSGLHNSELEYICKHLSNGDQRQRLRKSLELAGITGITLLDELKEWRDSAKSGTESINRRTSLFKILKHIDLPGKCVS